MQMWQMDGTVTQVEIGLLAYDGIWLEWRLVSGAYARIFNWILL